MLKSASGLNEVARRWAASPQRLGACVAGCGLCCTDPVLPVPTQWLTADVKYWLEGYGIKVWQRGPVLTSMRVVGRECKHLQADADKSCGRYETRPQVCKGWPYRPSDLETVEHCGYTFDAGAPSEEEVTGGG